MTSNQKTLIVSLSVLVLTLSLACIGSSEPVAMGDIPIYDGATTVTAGDDPLVDLVIESMKESAAGEDISMETGTYALPSGTSWDDVKTFYTDQLKDSDWEPADELSDESEDFKTLGWQRGPAYQEQLLVVAYLPDIFGKDAATLIVMLFSE